MPYISPPLGLSATTLVSWMIQCGKRDSWNCHVGDKNFNGRGRFSTSVVNGEFIIRIIPSKFSPPLSFMALLNLFIFFLMLRSSFSILEESFPEVLSRLLAWEFDSSSFWFSIVYWRFVFWDSIIFHSSSFWWVSSSTLARRAWICCYYTVSGCCAASTPSCISRNPFVTRKDGLND